MVCDGDPAETVIYGLKKGGLFPLLNRNQGRVLLNIQVMRIQ